MLDDYIFGGDRETQAASFSNNTFTTKEQAQAAVKIFMGVPLLGGVVQAVIEPYPGPQPNAAINTSYWFLRFANGARANVGLLLAAIANGQHPHVIAQQYAVVFGAPNGVSAECAESELHAIRNQLAATLMPGLAPLADFGVIAQGALDTDFEGKFNLLPTGNVKANYIILLPNLSTGFGPRGSVAVNAAFIGMLLKDYGPAAALGFAKTRQKVSAVHHDGNLGIGALRDLR
jgi:hypothetical protein